jgi:hypothetical protein
MQDADGRAREALLPRAFKFPSQHEHPQPYPSPIEGEGSARFERFGDIGASHDP